jgi:hypothetical protein
MVAYERAWAKIEREKEYQVEVSSSVTKTLTYKYTCPLTEETMIISELPNCFALAI